MRKAGASELLVGERRRRDLSGGVVQLWVDLNKRVSAIIDVEFNICGSI